MTTSTAIKYKAEQDSNANAYELVDDRPASDEADDLVAALLARERLDSSSGKALSLEESMRALGIDPGDFGLE
jgi:hypothetical protein